MMINLWVGILFILFHLFSLLFLLLRGIKCSYILNFDLLIVGNLNLDFVLIVDWMSLIFSSFVYLISSVIMIYRLFYIGNIKIIRRFNLLLILFVLSMQIVILRPSLVRIILGWDGLGIISFCLVIYYLNVKSLTSGLLTIYINRIGDVMILLSIVYFFNSGVWCNIRFLLNKYDLIALLIVIAGFTKRAQIPFSAWLPAAMSAPTPVSALVHSSTLVTAGVYLIMRNNFILKFSFLSLVFLLIRALTMIISGLLACVEKDIKKVIAISTLSQLGIIILVLFNGEVTYSFIHITCHALFKALLFLRCGVFIILRFGSQDSRFNRGYGVLIPLTRLILITSSLSLIGFPFSSGFYSKDLLIEMRFFSMSFILMGVMIIGCLITFFYSFRLLLIGIKMGKLGNIIIFLRDFSLLTVRVRILFIWIILSGLILRFILELGSWWVIRLMPKLIGIFILIIGVTVLLLGDFFFDGWFLMDIIFLKWISTSGISWVIILIKMILKRDVIWGELIGPSGLKILLINRRFKIVKRMFIKNYLIVLIMLFVLIVIIYI